MTTLLERDVIVVSHPIVALYPKALGQQQLGKMKPDEPSSSSDENTHQ